MGAAQHGRIMLVLGCMRSASTSLSEFLISVTGLPRHFVRSLPERIEGYEHYPSSTASCIPKEMLSDWVCSRDYVIQEHLLPIPKHREILLSIPRKQRKVVITKRKWQDSFESQLKRSGNCPYGSKTVNKEECRMSFKKFREDLEIYFPPEDGYLHVNFDNLINNQVETLAKVLDYFEINYDPKDLVLGRHRTNNE